MGIGDWGLGIGDWGLGDYVVAIDENEELEFCKANESSLKLSLKEIPANPTD